MPIDLLKAAQPYEETIQVVNCCPELQEALLDGFGLENLTVRDGRLFLCLLRMDSFVVTQQCFFCPICGTKLVAAKPYTH